MGTIHHAPFYNLEIVKGESEYLYDVNGDRYLDLRSGLWNVGLGYNGELMEKLIVKLTEQMKMGLPYLDIHSYCHARYEEYSDQLLEFINIKSYSFSKMFYTNSGSEGTELAIKLVRHMKGKDVEILSFNKGYHGTFFGGMSASGIDEHVSSQYQPLVPNFKFVEAPTTMKEEQELLQKLRELKNPSAFIFEPIIGSGGILSFSQSFFEQLHEIRKDTGLLIIFDEVATGFYRTGTRFAFHKLRFEPDILILGKAINNGVLPFGVVVINKVIEQTLLKQQTFIEHFSTQNGNLLGLISAQTVLHFYEKEEKQLHANVLAISEVMQQFSPLVRSYGSMGAIPINQSGKTIQIVKELMQFKILVYHYHNDEDDNGIALFPTLYMKPTLLNKVLNLIIRRL